MQADILFVETCLVFMMHMCGTAARCRLIHRSVSEHLTMSVTSLYDDKYDHVISSTTTAFNSAADDKVPLHILYYTYVFDTYIYCNVDHFSVF